MGRTRILTGSPENHAATAALELFEDRSSTWSGKPGNADAHPWRLP